MYCTFTLGVKHILSLLNLFNIFLLLTDSPLPVLRVGVSLTAIFTFYLEDKLTGLDVETWKIAGKKLGFKPEFVVLLYEENLETVS